MEDPGTFILIKGIYAAKNSEPRTQDSELRAQNSELRAKSTKCWGMVVIMVGTGDH